MTRTEPPAAHRTRERVLLGVVVLAHLVVLYSPRVVDPGTGLPLDKVVHAAIFGGVLRAGVRAGLRPGPLAVLLAVHAPVSEVVQATVVHRDGNVPDALADLAGLAIAWWFVVIRPGRRAAGKA